MIVVIVLKMHMEAESTREDKTFYVEVLHQFAAYKRKLIEVYNHSRFGVPSLFMNLKIFYTLCGDVRRYSEFGVLILVGWIILKQHQAHSWIWFSWFKRNRCNTDRLRPSTPKSSTRKGILILGLSKTNRVPDPPEIQTHPI